MLQSNIQMSYFIKQVKSIVLSMVIKRDKVAQSYETSLEAIKAADKYINTIDYGHLWDSYVKFDRDILEAAGLDRNLLSWYEGDKNNIPRAMRDKVVQLQKEKIISSYVEENDYYRMLAGQPPFAETEADWVYVPENVYGIPTDIPIHKLSVEYVNYLRSSGLLSDIIKANPKKGYLNYLSDRAINYYTARTASNFDILYVDTNKLETNIYSDFRIFYDKARAYYMISMYNKEYADMFVWYDEFIGFAILIMAIQRLVANIYKQGLTRDFYDVELIKYLFKSYSIPYIDTMDLKYQINLAKSLNVLLQYKSTDRVLYDVSYLLGFHNVNIYRYYLVKNHRLDNDGHPIFVYDEITEEDGTITKKPVYPHMYTFHFQQINLKEKDINTALTDTRNTMDYYSIITEDPYWVDDDELRMKLYESNYNNIITKYMSLDVAFKIVEMMYEVAHTLRMFIDNQKDFKLITINVPKVTANDISLYDLAIFLCVLGAKKMGLKGSIPIKGYQIPSVYGFNYKANLEKLREDIYNNEGDYTLIDPELVKYILNMRATSSDDVDRLFSNITAFRKLISLYLFKTKDKETYYQYKKLYKAILLTEDVQDLYKDYEGNVHQTYESLLKEINPELYSVYLNILEQQESVDEYIDAIFIKLSTLSIEYKYLSSINRNEMIFEFIMKLIRFFKSYTVDFVNSGIHYFLDDRYLMGLKLMEMYWMSSDMELRDTIFNNGNWYKDYINTIGIGMQVKDDLTIRDWQEIENFLFGNGGTIKFDDKLFIDSEHFVKDEPFWVDYAEFGTDIYLGATDEQGINFKDKMYLDFEIHINMVDKLKIKDIYDMNVKDVISERFRMVDDLQMAADISLVDKKNNTLSLKDKMYLSFRIEELGGVDKLKLKDIDYIGIIDSHSERYELFDDLFTNKEIFATDKAQNQINFRDSLHIDIEEDPEEEVAG